MRALKEVLPRAVRIRLRRRLVSLRQVTSAGRVLPDFLIIGAQKSGTTSLYEYLSQHPQIAQPFWKEVHYFDGGLNPGIDNFAKGPTWYRAHFPYRWQMSGKKTFEASPYYIFSPLAAERMHDRIPDARLIAVLRDPTERAISHYFHTKRANKEPLSPLEALQEEERRLEPEIRSGTFNGRSFVNHSYKSRGLYAEQLERYFRYFPAEQMLIINSDELFAEPGKILKQVFAFVGIDQAFEVPDVRPRLAAGNKDKVDPAVYDYLNDFFAPHNQALYELTGRDFGW